MLSESCLGGSRPRLKLFGGTIVQGIITWRQLSGSSYPRGIAIESTRTLSLFKHKPFYMELLFLF